jgi:hypothetical protein
MKTAVQELITYFEQQKKQGCKNWCIEDLLAQLYQAKEMEKEQIIEAWNTRAKIDGVLTFTDNRTAEQYYNETFKSE